MVVVVADAAGAVIVVVVVGLVSLVVMMLGDVDGDWGQTWGSQVVVESTNQLSLHLQQFDPPAAQLGAVRALGMAFCEDKRGVGEYLVVLLHHHVHDLLHNPHLSHTHHYSQSGHRVVGFVMLVDCGCGCCYVVVVVVVVCQLMVDAWSRVGWYQTLSCKQLDASQRLSWRQ